MEKDKLNETENIVKDVNTSPNALLPQKPIHSNFSIQPDNPGVYDQINHFFSEQDRQTKTIEEARETLGEDAKSLSDEQVYDLVNEVQYLCDTWLEEYERKIFDGKTVDELTKM